MKSMARRTEATTKALPFPNRFSREPALAGRGGFGRQTGLRGNPVDGGDYRIKMTVNGKILTGEIVVREDPLRRGGN